MKRAASLCSVIAAIGLVSTGPGVGLDGMADSSLTTPEPVRSVGSSQATGGSALETLLAATNEVQWLASWRRVLKQKDGPEVIAQALPRSGFPAWIASAGLRIIREERLVEPDLVLALARAAGLA